MTHWGARTRQMGTFPVNLENIRVFAGGFGNRLFTQKAGSRNFPSSIQPPGSLRSKRNNPFAKEVSPSPSPKTPMIVRPSTFGGWTESL